MAASRYKTAGTTASPPWEAPKALATGAGNLRALTVANKGSVAAYVFICDATSDTAAAVLYAPYVVDAGDARVVSFGPAGLGFATGCYIAMSSSLATYTAIASADFNFNADLMPADTIVVPPSRMQA